MSAAWYIVLERKIPGLHLEVDGKALAKQSELLDPLAKDAGVKPLIDFFSIAPDLAAFRDHDLKISKIPEEQWFLAEDGLKTVMALKQAIQIRNLDQIDRIVDDLQGFADILESAKNNGVGWHLSIDF